MSGGRFDPQLMKTLGRVAGHVAWEKVRKPRVETISDVPRTPDDVTREWLTKAAGWTEQETHDGRTGWNRRITLQLLRREAEALVTGAKE